jgi:hypothetical protein
MTPRPTVAVPPVGARQAVPVLRMVPSLPVGVSPLYAMLTKNEGGLPEIRPRFQTSFVVAQLAAPLAPKLPIEPGARSACSPPSEPTPTVDLSPLSAMFTKNRGAVPETPAPSPMSLVGAQFIGPSSPTFSTPPRATNLYSRDASRLRVSLTPLSAMLTENRGVLFEP